MACLLLLETAGESSLNLLLSHISVVGPDGSCFQEESFSNKRILPGWQPRGVSPKWARRLRATEPSFHLMLRFLVAANSKKLPVLRRKFDKSVMEETANMASLLMSLAGELEEEAPINPDKIE